MDVKDNAIFGLLKAGSKLAKKYAANFPFLYETTANTIDNIVDAPKVAMDYYAREFRPSPQVMDRLQNIKDFVGEFSNVPMAPPFLGRGKTDRGYLPMNNMSMGSDASGGFGFYDPYVPYAASSNASLAKQEQDQLDRVRKPFEDWSALHNSVKQRFDDTVKFQADLRKNPAIIKASGGDPKKLASIIHNLTLARNEKLRNSGQLFNAADALRGYRFYKDPMEERGSMKSGNMIEPLLELPNMTGRVPYIIR